ncbi:hypothetical protein ACLB2K_044858 [Fragaria x ananassa]
MEDHGSRNIDVEALEKSLKAKLCSDSRLSAKCCIFRVPELLRRHKPEAHQPDIVSIGPFHGSGELFEPMKKVKLWYLDTLLLRKCVCLKALIQGIDKITGFEERARDYYADSIDHLNHKEFVEMMIIDGCFLLALLWRSYYVYPDSDTVDDPLFPDSDTVDDPLFNMSCMYQYLCHDLLLLENQLPWFVLESLHSLICNNQVPLTTLVLNFFSRLSSMSDYCEGYTNHTHDEEILHILDLIRSAIVVPFRKFESTESKYALPHATALLEAGIEFRRSSVDGLMNIDFKDGVLTIPQLAIAEMTEPLFRNLIAFEQCYHGRMHQVASYAFLMDKLISSSKDVVFLCDKQIFYNWFSAEEGS